MQPTKKYNSLFPYPIPLTDCQLFLSMSSLLLYMLLNLSISHVIAKVAPSVACLRAIVPFHHPLSLLILFLFSHQLMLTLYKTNIHMCFLIDFVHTYNIMRQGRPLFNIMNLSCYNFPSNICAQPNSLLYSFPFYSSSLNIYCLMQLFLL